MLNVIHISWHHGQDDEQAPVVADVSDEEADECSTFQNLKNRRKRKFLNLFKSKLALLNVASFFL